MFATKAHRRYKTDLPNSFLKNREVLEKVHDYLWNLLNLVG